MGLYLPVIAMLIGCLMYSLTSGKLAELGRILFAFGLLVTLMQLSSGRLIH